MSWVSWNVDREGPFCSSVVVKNLLMLLLKIIALNIWIKIEKRKGKGKIDSGK